MLLSPPMMNLSPQLASSVVLLITLTSSFSFAETTPEAQITLSEVSSSLDSEPQTAEEPKTSLQTVAAQPETTLSAITHSASLKPRIQDEKKDTSETGFKTAALSREHTQDATEKMKVRLFQQLAIDRSDPTVSDSQMTTQRILGVVTGDQVYKFVMNKGIIAVTPREAHQSGVRRFKKQLNFPPRDLQYTDIEGHWDSETHGSADESNILGGYGRLTLKTMERTLQIPIVQATEDTLRYYKAHLLHSGDHFRFETEREFPIFEMSIGKNYVPSFVMKGKGLYLEYHNEPHYHEPMNTHTGGVYLLARIMTDPVSSQEWVRITAFRVPYGTAVYSEPGAIHDDATTQGQWRVGYIDAKEFSTVLIRNQRDEKIAFEFQEKTLSAEDEHSP